MKRGHGKSDAFDPAKAAERKHTGTEILRPAQCAPPAWWGRPDLLPKAPPGRENLTPTVDARPKRGHKEGHG